MNDRTEQALTDALVDQIESAARESFLRHQRSIKGQTLTAADNYDWHLLHAAYQAGIDTLRAQLAEPIDMVLHCPACGMQHIDAVEELPMPMPGSSFEGSAGWTNPPHRSHLCHGCGHIWRPADVPTNGVEAVKTCGKADSKLAAPADTLRAQLAEAQRDAERLDWMIEQCAYVVSAPECCGGYWLNYPRKDGTLWTQATEHETPRAAIDAAKGESDA